MFQRFPRLSLFQQHFRQLKPGHHVPGIEFDLVTELSNRLLGRSIVPMDPGHVVVQRRKAVIAFGDGIELLQGLSETVELVIGPAQVEAVHQVRPIHLDGPLQPGQGFFLPLLLEQDHGQVEVTARLVRPQLDGSSQAGFGLGQLSQLGEDQPLEMMAGGVVRVLRQEFVGDGQSFGVVPLLKGPDRFVVALAPERQEAEAPDECRKHPFRVLVKLPCGTPGI